MSFTPREYLRYILAETDFLLDHSRDLSREEFEADEVLRRAFVRSLEIIVEATKKLSMEFRSSHPEVEWRLIAGMRDRLIHGYFGIDHQLVWEVVQEKVPDLQRKIKRFLESGA